jgi:hypothetical protein
MNPQEFVAKWEHVDLKESASDRGMSFCGAQRERISAPVDAEGWPS